MKKLSAIALSLLCAGCSATPYTGETITETTTPKGLNVIQSSARTKLPNGVLAGEESELQELTATVESISSKTGMVKLQTPDGRIVELKADPKAPNFKNVKKGDKLVLDVYEAIDFEVRKPTQEELAMQGVDVDVAAVADKGQKPAAVLASTRVDVLTIDKIDTQKETLTLSNAGSVVTVKAKYPQNLKVLKVGDTVVVKTSELVAARIKQVG